MQNIIARIAKENNTTVEEVRKEMQEAIHAAYLAGTPSFKALFGDYEPTVEEFLQKATLSMKIKGTLAARR